jgi:hypothetical protein
MKNLFSTVCVLAVFLLVTLACSNTGKSSYDTKPTTSTSQNSSNTLSISEYSTNTAPTIEPTIEKAKSAFKAVVVIAEGSSLRKTPSQNGEVIDLLSEDANLEVLKQRGAWFLVRTDDGLEGWMHGNTIRYADSTQSGNWTASQDLKVEPETDTRYVLPEEEYVPAQPSKTVARETRRAEALETPVPIYRSTPGPDYSQRDETSSLTTDESSSSTPTALCVDGTYSYSANRRGTCSWHGGVAEWLNSTPSSSSPETYPRSSSGDSTYRPKTVNVRGYTRRDGTYVAPYTRSAPRRRN